MGLAVMRLLPVFIIFLFFCGAIIFSFMAWSSIKIGKDYEIKLNERQQQQQQQKIRYFTNNGEDGMDSYEPVANSADEAENAVKDLERLKMKVVSNLRRFLLNGAKFREHINEYGVNYTNLVKSKAKANRQEMMCRIKNLKFNILNEGSSGIFRGKKFPEESIFNIEPQLNDYERDFQENQQPLYRSCAVISNSAALLDSRHGIDIDSHDFIIRFNNAPTEGYEEDVGSQTALRILNSKAATNKNYAFPYASRDPFIFREKLPSPDANKLERIWNSTKKYLIWDPCNFTSTLDDWYKKPEFPIFEKYFDLTSKSKGRYEKNRYYMLDCRVIWNIWRIIQEFTFTKMAGTPPTSGFLGIIIALQNCETVDVYEYIPSLRESERCHYYGLKNETNVSCTYGTWHPVSAEKLFVLGLTSNTPEQDKQIFVEGVLSLKGVSQFQC